MAEDIINDHLVLVCGKSAAGKTASLRGIEDQPKWMYLNCESGKRTPFKSDFMKGPNGKPGFTITNAAQQIPKAFAVAEKNPECTGIIIDSQTYLMDMYEMQNVRNAQNGQQAWGEYAFFFRNLMQEHVARSTKIVVFTAHVLDTYNEKDMLMEVAVPIKGQLKAIGIESFFSVVVAAKRMSLAALEPYHSDYLNITAADKALGIKYVFQTQLTAETIGERIRGPMGMWTPEETFIDNNVQFLMDRLHDFYDD